MLTSERGRESSLVRQREILLPKDREKGGYGGMFHPPPPPDSQHQAQHVHPFTSEISIQRYRKEAFRREPRSPRPSWRYKRAGGHPFALPTTAWTQNNLYFGAPPPPKPKIHAFITSTLLLNALHGNTCWWKLHYVLYGVLITEKKRQVIKDAEI